MTPGRKFSTTMSVVATRRRTASTAAGDLRSSATLFLPALSWPKLVLAPSRSGGRVRIMSPAGDSILITSAPRSARRRVQCGPAIVVVKSSTRRPPKALVIRSLPIRRVLAGSGLGRKCQAAPPTSGLLLPGRGAYRAAPDIEGGSTHGVSQHTGGDGDLSRAWRRPRRLVLRAPNQRRPASRRRRDPPHAGLGRMDLRGRPQIRSSRLRRGGAEPLFPRRRRRR